MKKYLNMQKGFTLVEMILYTSMLTVFLIVLTGIFIASLDVKSESETASDINQDGRFILSRIIYDIHRAESISVPQNIGNTSSTLTAVINGINYIYSQNNNNLELTNNLGTDQLNGFDTQISGFTVKRIGNIGGRNSFVINYSVTSKTLRNGQTESKTFQTTIAQRCISTISQQH
jgi:hypothetical protein